MAAFLLRLISPRPTFPFDMSPAEAAAMHAHAANLQDLAARGVAVAFGPVNDPSGPWGLLIAEVDDIAAANALAASDPAIRADLGLRYEVLPMFSLGVGVRP